MLVKQKECKSIHLCAGEMEDWNTYIQYRFGDSPQERTFFPSDEKTLRKFEISRSQIFFVHVFNWSIALHKMNNPKAICLWRGQDPQWEIIQRRYFESRVPPNLKPPTLFIKGEKLVRLQPNRVLSTDCVDLLIYNRMIRNGGLLQSMKMSGVQSEVEILCPLSLVVQYNENMPSDMSVKVVCFLTKYDLLVGKHRMNKMGRNYTKRTKKEKYF